MKIFLGVSSCSECHRSSQDLHPLPIPDPEAQRECLLFGCSRKCSSFLVECIPKTHWLLEVGANHQPDSRLRAEGTLHRSSDQSSVGFAVQGCAMKDTREALPPGKCLPSVQDSKRQGRLPGERTPWHHKAWWRSTHCGAMTVPALCIEMKEANNPDTER